MKYLLIVYSLLAAQNLVLGQTSIDERKLAFNLDKYNVAIQGYDPVSYFEGKAQKGNANLYFFYKGVRYEFASQQHLELFKTTPEKYEPAYGGWCAYAMGATGEKVEIDPTKFKVKDGKLYLFYYSIVNNTLNKWNADEANLKPKADNNWKKLNPTK